MGSEGNDHFVVLDYVSGDTLSRIMRDLKKAKTAMPAWIAVWIGAQIASALHAAHDAKNLAGETLNIVHRDVSLPNIMLSDAGHPMLFDFGVAKAKQRMVETSHGELKGKLAYMAPETFHGAPADRTVDVYGLGIVLYELLAGKSPISAPATPRPSPRCNVRRSSRRSSRREVDTSLDDVVLRAMARDRAARYATADELERALRDWAREAGVPHEATAVSAWLAKTFPERRHARAALLSRVANPGEVTVLDAVSSTPLDGGTPVSGPVSASRHLRTPHSGQIPAPQAHTPISVPNSASMLRVPAAVSTPPPRPPRGHGPPHPGAHTGLDFEFPGPRRRPWLALAGALSGAIAGVVGVVMLLDPSRRRRPARPRPQRPHNAATTDVAASAETAAPDAAPAASASAAGAGTASSAASPSAAVKAAARPPAQKAAAKPPAKPGAPKAKGPLVREYE